MTNFLKIFQVTVFLSIVFLLTFNVVLAEKHFPVLSTGSEVLNIDFDKTGCTPDPDNEQLCQINWIGQYISGIYRYGISLAAVLAVVMVMVGGFIWLSSGGSADKIKTAKSFIGSAFAGLLLALFAFVILNTINPRLVNLDPLKIQSIKNVESAENYQCFSEVSQNQCNKAYIIEVYGTDVGNAIDTVVYYADRSCNSISLCGPSEVITQSCCVVKFYSN